MQTERAEIAPENSQADKPAAATQPAPLTFLMVGCQRCGSTWVDKALRGHPEIYTPPQKQTYFFDLHYDRGIDWYVTNFDGVQPGHKAVGEIATGYCLPHAIPRMAEHFPDVQLIMSMRNPIDRAYSFYQSRSAKFGWSSFDEAAEARPEILERGRYIEQIELLLKYYDRDRLLLLFYDDLKADDRSYLKSILQFLQVDETFESKQIGKVVQVAIFPKLRRRLNRMGLSWAVDLVSKSPLGDLLRKRMKTSKIQRYKPMPDDLRARLVEYYKPLNDRLAAFAGRDLSHWNK